MSQATRPERFALFFLALLTVVAACRVAPFELPFPLSALEAEALWALAPAWLVLGVALALRWRSAGALAGLVCLAHLGWAFDWVPRAMARPAAEASTRPLRVVSANLLAPRPSRELARALAEADADVLLVQELSIEWAELLREEGFHERFSYRFLEPHPLDEDYFGIGIYARVPITERERIDLGGVPLLRADLDVGGTPLRVYSVHTLPPSSARLHERWSEQMRELRERIAGDVDAGRALVLGGDLNASPTMRAYRELLGTGARAAHEDAFRGLATTWPNGVFMLPPMRLDHVLVSGAAVRSVSEGSTTSSDHLPVIVDLGVTSAR